MSKKLTPWFPASVKPVREGVYQRDWSSRPGYALWSEGVWHWTSWVSAAEAAVESGISRATAAIRWRGLASDPGSTS
jgi:hypothetical protein